MEINKSIEENKNGLIKDKEPPDILETKNHTESSEFTLYKAISNKTVNQEDVENSINKSSTSSEEESHKTLKKFSNNPSEYTFKKPEFIRPHKDFSLKVNNVVHDVPNEIVNDSNTQLNSINGDFSNKVNNTQKSEYAFEFQNERQITFPYVEPLWSGVPDGEYKLEILKSGVILDTVNLSNKSYHVVGRLPSCDISLAHPTISRNHAIIQYRKVVDENNEKGLYVYDLGSTHGTFWNGNRIKSKVYVRLQRGHMFSFGCSQRKFILQAPLDDEEQETELSYTQLKEMRRLKLAEIERIKEQELLEKQKEEALRKEKEEIDGIDWGMGEDADEETDLTENPYAQTNNEELFLDDPKKTLRGWFEREGYDLQYEVEEKGVGKFLCWVNLPIDGNKTVRAEALTTGKKKEAVVQCALEACRTLDRYGLLRQANHETRKRKTRNWAEEDYYDSDEDNFLDRTGTVEKKREQRMKMAGKFENKAETYDTLLEKHSKVVERITNIENMLLLHKSKQNEIDDTQEDALDAFMSNLGSLITDKGEIRKLKLELLNLRKEETQLLKLINIAKPANLPALKPYSQDITSKSKDNIQSYKCSVGLKKASRLSMNKFNRSESKNEKSKEERVHSLRKPVDTRQGNEKLINEKQNPESVKRLEIYNDNIKCTKEGKFEDETEVHGLIYVNSKKKKSNERKTKQEITDASNNLEKDNQESKFRENYSMWLPPKDQTGDGKTSLNEKFGY